ncbi:MAG: hypothetical protein ACFFCS_15385 [Candidatus Hodarchaeota archaeon]
MKKRTKKITIPSKEELDAIDAYVTEYLRRLRDVKIVPKED